VRTPCGAIAAPRTNCSRSDIGSRRPPSAASCAAIAFLRHLAAMVRLGLSILPPTPDHPGLQLLYRRHGAASDPLRARIPGAPQPPHPIRQLHRPSQPRLHDHHLIGSSLVLSRDELRSAVDYACLVASLTVARAGADLIPASRAVRLASPIAAPT